MTTGDRGRIQSLDADSVYMLLHPGWSTEARSNRWHFATRWARHLPVVLVVPETAFPWHVEMPELRISNSRILKTVANGGDRWSRRAQIEIAQIREDMRKYGHERPLLWLYNAFFEEAYAAVPAAARVHHATEAYYDFPDMSHFYLDRLANVARISDLTVAVSEGCAAPLKQYADLQRIVVVSNGCDFGMYGAEVIPDAAVCALREGFRKVAVFAGYINDRLDFPLIEKLARAASNTVFLFVGKMELNLSLASEFSALLRLPNVRHWNAVAPERLPAIYRAADVGFMPFSQTRLAVENGFPLKTMEMAATGLPVVSTLLRPLLPHSPPLVVTQDAEAFVNAVSRAERRPDLAADLRRLAMANDYDVKFAEILDRLVAIGACAGPRIALEDQSKLAATTEGWKFADLLPGLMYRFARPVSRFIDWLPPSMRKRVITIKRRIVG